MLVYPVPCGRCQRPIDSQESMGLLVRTEIVHMGRHIENAMKVMCRDCQLGKDYDPQIYDIEGM